MIWAWFDKSYFVHHVDWDYLFLIWNFLNEYVVVLLEHEHECFFLHLHPYTKLCVIPYIKCEKYFFILFVSPPYIIQKIFLDWKVFFRFIKIWDNPMNYTIQKLISYPEKTFELCNSETYYKRLLNYIIE